MCREDDPRRPHDRRSPSPEEEHHRLDEMDDEDLVGVFEDDEEWEAQQMIPLHHDGPEARREEGVGSTAVPANGSHPQQTGVHARLQSTSHGQRHHPVQQGSPNVPSPPGQPTIPNGAHGQPQGNSTPHSTGSSQRDTTGQQAVQREVWTSLAALVQKIQIVLLLPMVQQQVHQTVHMMQQLLPPGTVPIAGQPPSHGYGSPPAWPPVQQQQHQHQLLILLTAQLTAIAWSLQQPGALSDLTTSTTPQSGPESTTETAPFPEAQQPVQVEGSTSAAGSTRGVANEGSAARGVANEESTSLQPHWISQMLQSVQASIAQQPVAAQSSSSTAPSSQDSVPHVQGTVFPQQASTQPSWATTWFAGDNPPVSSTQQATRQSEIPSMPVTNSAATTAASTFQAENDDDDSSTAADASSTDTGESNSRASKRRKYNHDYFPSKLHRLICDAETSGKGRVVGFLDGGVRFQISDPTAFEEELLPNYFRHTSMRSISRSLRMYSFRRVQGTSWTEGIFEHPLFQKDAPELCKQMERTEPNCGSLD